MYNQALRYLLEQTDASEYTNAYDDCNIAWNVIANIMEHYAAARAEDAVKKDRKRITDELNKMMY